MSLGHIRQGLSESQKRFGQCGVVFRRTEGIESPGKELPSLPWSRGTAALPGVAWWDLEPSAPVIDLLS